MSSREFTEVSLPESYHVATLDNDAQTIFEESADFIAARLPDRWSIATRRRYRLGPLVEQARQRRVETEVRRFHAHGLPFLP